MQTETEQKTSTSTSLTERLISLISSVIEPMGFEVVYLEVQNQRQRLLRLYIDRQDLKAQSADDKRGGITVDHCADVSRALDEPLEKFSEIDSLFKGTYELEVSSPGVDRPLRLEKDYVRFVGREARIHVFRPLSAEEIANADYQSKNPRQKNFLGTLKGFENGKVLLSVSTGGDTGSAGKSAKGKKTGHSKTKTNSAEGPNGDTRPDLVVAIPLPLISKANLEPKFDFDSDEDAVEIEL